MTSFLEWLSGELNRPVLDELTEVRRIVATNQEELQQLNTEVEALQGSLDNLKTRVTTDLDALKAEVERLASEADIDLGPVTERIDALKDEVDSIDPVPPTEPV